MFSTKGLFIWHVHVLEFLLQMNEKNILIDFVMCKCGRQLYDKYLLSTNTKTEY